MTLQQTVFSPPPLPGGVAAVLRFLFNLPQWIQIAGFLIGIAVAAVAVVWLWRHRRETAAWIVARPRGTKIGLIVAAATGVLLFGGFGAVSWNYMQHDNAFCSGCHIMNTPFQRFAGSKHDSLSCHACHQQSIFASTRQLYLWVADRPQEIRVHSKVPTRVCASCHVLGDREKEKWRRIATTAGHRVHLESDSSALRGIECTTCHGLEVHRFVPVNATCAQSGCHVNTVIRLGKMAGQTGMHCIACHQFTADVPLLATRDSAAGTLRPGAHECLGCHEMRAMLAGFDPARDPHGQTCGMCHNPHTQTRPADALKSCASAGCHADWRNEPFHTGAPHRGVAVRCTLCHPPHGAKVDASDCAGCHTSVRERSHGRRTPPMPFDTTGALRRTSWVPPHGQERMKGKGDAPPFDDPPWPRAHGPAATPPDSFPHSRHTSLACITCHVSTRPGTRLTFEAPRGCQICHHQAAAAGNCASCHAATELEADRAATVRVTVAGHAERLRLVAFAHATHKDIRCVTCHTTAVTLESDASVAACRACHEDHHTARRDCAACHAGAEPAAAHREPVQAHVGCDACHGATTVARLVPDRTFCLTCHAPQREHYVDRECTVCHFQAAPDAYRAHLRKAGA